VVLPKAKIGHPYGRREASKIAILNAVLCSARQRRAAPFQGGVSTLLPLPQAALGRLRFRPARSGGAAGEVGRRCS
jgi:hypothetical protein